MATGNPADPQTAFAELGRIRLSENSLNEVFSRVAAFARNAVAAAHDVSVTIVDGADPYTAAFTGDLAKSLDEWQYRGDGGPCIEAAMSATTVSVPDLTRERRWVDYTRHAIDAGVRSSLSVGLPAQESVPGALNLYALRVDAFDDRAVTVAQTFAGYAAVALANARSYDATVTVARQMRDAMEHRAVIEQAKGIIMADQHCTADEAFARLSKLSQDTNTKLRDVAASLVARASRSP